MRRVLILCGLLLAISAQLCASDRFGGMRLLEGYSIKQNWAVDASAWTIEKKKGLTIYFEAGLSEGSWASRKDERTYAWYREQTINGYRVRLALIKAGLKTRWEPENGRGLKPGNILLVTFLLEGEQSSHTANFVAKIANSQELADVLLMVVTFDPSKGVF